MSRSRWTTWQITSFTHAVHANTKSQGGVLIHRVRKTPAGWEERVIQSNGVHDNTGPITKIADAEGEQRYALAEKQFAAED